MVYMSSSGTSSLRWDQRPFKVIPKTKLLVLLIWNRISFNNKYYRRFGWHGKYLPSPLKKNWYTRWMAGLSSLSNSSGRKLIHSPQSAFIEQLSQLNTKQQPPAQNRSRMRTTPGVYIQGAYVEWMYLKIHKQHNQCVLLKTITE